FLPGQIKAENARFAGVGPRKRAGHSSDDSFLAANPPLVQLNRRNRKHVVDRAVFTAARSALGYQSLVVIEEQAMAEIQDHRLHHLGDTLSFRMGLVGGRKTQADRRAELEFGNVLDQRRLLAGL